MVEENSLHSSLFISSAFEPNLVSVIIPTKNRSNFLGETLNSVLLQTYRPIEVIVVDDGSTDKTVDLVSAWQSNYSNDSDFRVFYYYQTSRGAPCARNLGLIKSQGEYIQYLDSDDLLHPKKLEIQVYAMRTSEECEYIWSDHTLFENSKDISFSAIDLTEKNILDFPSFQAEVMKIPNTCWSGLYRRKLCARVGSWNENLVRWQDFEYNVRVAQLTPISKYVNVCLYYWRSHLKGRIEDLSKESKGVDEALKSLKAVEEVINKDGQLIDGFVRSQMSKYHFIVACQALKCGAKDSFHLALEKCLIYRQDFGFKSRVLFLKFLAFICSGKIAIFLINSYSSLALKIYKWSR